MATGKFTHNSYRTKILKTAHKKAQKRSENIKPWIQNFVSTGMNFAKIWLSVCANGCVRFTKYCGKMYSHHFFPTVDCNLLLIDP